ncbi:MAG TPA: glycosyltransferase [Microvirga sp.]|nr:glycosyltransferase [Microvirga sp.]
MAAPMTSEIAFEAVTALCIVDTRLPSIAAFEALERQLARVATDYEIMIVANGVETATAQHLRELTDRIANVTVHFLAQRTDRDAAILLGIDQALGDWIVVLTPNAEEVASLPKLFKKAGPYEIVFAGARPSADIPAPYRRVAWMYFKLYETISGLRVDWPAPRVRIYSRAAARYLTSMLDGEFALRSLNISGAFPGTRETIDNLPSSDLELPQLGRALRKAFRGLLLASAVPLRAMIGIALFAGFFAVLSSLYAVVTYLLKDDVAPGWTTLSLQISMMTFLFAAMFALLAEYVLNMYRAIAPRRRIAIVRELRSPIRRQVERLNVVGADGAFKLGAPSERGLAGSKEVHQ